MTFRQHTIGRHSFVAARIFLGVASLASLAGCGDSGPTKPSSVLTTLTVTVPVSTLAPGETTTASVSGVDQTGAKIATGTVTWSSSAITVATVTSAGVIAGVSPGQAQIIASAGGKQGRTTISVVAPVANVTLTPSNSVIGVDGVATITATATDAGGSTLTGRTFSWTVSNAVRQTSTGNVLVATGASVGTATVTATSEGKSGSATIVVAAPPPACAGSTMQLALGDVRTLTAAQVASLCVGGSVAGSEYVLIPFNNSAVAASTISLTMAPTNTSTIAAPALGDLRPTGVTISLGATDASQSASASAELRFHERERAEMAPRLNAMRAARGGRPARSRQLITGVAALPQVGSIATLNTNGSNACTQRQPHAARVVAVLPHTIVFLDTLAPAGGYTDAELIDFATSFDTLGYAIDTLNFGAPSDIDGNGRVGIFFTPGVNVIPVEPGAFVAGFFHSRDLLPISGAGSCAGSNEGEMFYVAVPDPNRVLNGNYTNKTSLAATVAGTLVHELQHMINTSRRFFVNPDATSLEETWLNEGLSHIAEELLYYRISGNSPRANINAPLLQSSQAQATAYNTYLNNGNFGRLRNYLRATESSSPYAANDGLATRGAIWQLLRYAADRKGGSEAATWRSLVNSNTSGQANFNAVLGNTVAMTRDWAVAQYTDDAGLNVASQYTMASWNFRSIYGVLGGWPLAPFTRGLPDGSPLTITLSGGSAAYVRFRAGSAIVALVSSTSSNQPVPSSVDFILVRTQ